MQKSWTGKNVDLDLLSDCIEGFFKDKGFLTRRTVAEKESSIFWARTLSKNLKEAMRVMVVGDSNDFVVKFEGAELARRSIWLGMLTKSIGGGHLVLRGSKLQETLEETEMKFWTFIEDNIPHLSGSAKHL